MSEHLTFAASVLRTILTSPATLTKLAARGMFASKPLNMPPDIHSGNITILCDGEVSHKPVIEVYAPGDETGWAVVYKPTEDGGYTGETELIFGKWLLCRGELPSKVMEVPTEESVGEPATGVFGLGNALGIDLEDNSGSEVPVAEDAPTVVVRHFGNLSGVPMPLTKTHPYAFLGNKGGFTDGNGRMVVAGDCVEYRFENHRRGILDEALQDGDAFVTWDDGSYATVKWCNLAKIP